MRYAIHRFFFAMSSDEFRKTERFLVFIGGLSLFFDRVLFCLLEVYVD